MLKLCTVLIGVQSALVRRDDHRSELQRQEEEKASPLAPVVQAASKPDWDGNLAAPVVQSASSMIESSRVADAEMSPTKVLTLLLGAGALSGTTSTANAFQPPTSMHGGVVARGILGPGIARTGPEPNMHLGPNDDNDLFATDPDVKLTVEAEDAELISTELSKRTVVQLKEQLRAVGLPVAGRKAELVGRLLSAAAPAAPPPEPAPPEGAVPPVKLLLAEDMAERETAAEESLAAQSIALAEYMAEREDMERATAAAETALRLLLGDDALEQDN